MKLLRNLMAIIVIALTLSACATGEIGKPVKMMDGSIVQVGSSATLNGKATMTVAYVPGKGYTHFIDRGPSVQGEMAKIGVGSVLPAAITTAGGIHIANQNRAAASSSSCSATGCGNTFVIQGGNASSNATAEGTIDFDSSLETSCSGSACE